MRILKPTAPTPSSITDEAVFHDRRHWLKTLLGGTAAAVGSTLPWPARSETGGAPLKSTRNAKFSVSDAPNTYEDITSYNNFYEFGTGKEDPKENAGTLKTRPWSVIIAGEAETTGTFSLEDILKPHALEERVYRFRCVEAWSMVVPWVGFPLSDLIRRYKPTSRAKFVEFTTLLDPKQMPGQRSNMLDWPYVEALRMDEAMHPLAMLVVGVYGKTLPNQNGAPLRLIVPWKYGFKSGKSITRIRFTEKQPRTTWNIAAPDEYGFFANVNPAVDHPRWSQASERKIGGKLFASRVQTLPFNGYAEQVAPLYRDMDLRRFY